MQSLALWAWVLSNPLLTLESLLSELHDGYLCGSAGPLVRTK